MKKAVACALAASALAGAAADFAVKPGDDLARVRAEARLELKEGRRVCVTLEPGVYTLAAPLKFEAADSGTEEAPAVWRAAQPGTTVYRALVDTGLKLKVDNASGGVYVDGIDDVVASTTSSNAGWLFTVNGETPNTDASNVQIANGDVVVWTFTTDYTTMQ